MNKTNEEVIELKRELLSRIVTSLSGKLSALRTAMDQAQEDANEHKGAMASRYDTFKEEAQALRDGFARQIQEVGDALAVLQQVEPGLTTAIQLGALIATNQGEYFVSTGAVEDKVIVDGEEYHLVSFASPLVAEMRRTRIGGEVVFRGDRFRIVSIA